MTSDKFIQRPKLMRLSIRARTIFHCCTDLHLSKLDFGSIPDAGFSLQPRPTLYEASCISAAGLILPVLRSGLLQATRTTPGSGRILLQSREYMSVPPLPSPHGCDADGHFTPQLPLCSLTACQGISARKGRLLDGMWATISPRKPSCRSDLIWMRPPLRPAPTTRHSRCLLVGHTEQEKGREYHCSFSVPWVYMHP